MLVTLFADASLDSATMVGGWGAWIKSSRGRIFTGGAFKSEIKHIVTAEIMAIANALAFGLKNGAIETGDRILIQSDSQTALDLLSGKSRKPKDKHEWKIASEFVTAWGHEQGVTLIFRHVKGHNAKSGEARHYVNTVCDKLARKAMRNARRASMNSS